MDDYGKRIILIMKKNKKIDDNQKMASVNIDNQELVDYFTLSSKGLANPITTIEEVFEGTSLNEIKEKINNFDQNRNSLNYNNSRERIKNVIMVDHKSTSASTFGLESRTMLPGSIFWRSRVVGDFKAILEETEFWAPSDGFVKKDGRVNYAGQGVLYTSVHPSTTALEVRSRAGDKIISISYEAASEIDVMWVEKKFKNIGYSGKIFKKIEKINNFISKNLRKIGQDAYIFSATFANHFLPQDCAGWVFKSTLDSSGWNYCFKPGRISEKLRILKIYTFECDHDGELGKLVGSYTKSEEGIYRYNDDQEFVINNWKKFIREKNGNGSSGDLTTVIEEHSPYTPMIITV